MAVAATDQVNNSEKPKEATLPLKFFKIKRNNQGEVSDVQILQAGFVQLLRELGFRKYEVGEGFIIIRIVENVIEQFQLHALRGFIVRYFHNMDEETLLREYECPKELLVEKLHRSLGTLTTEEKLSLLFDLDGKEEINVVEDDQATAYFFYQNGYVQVTRDGVELHPYKKLPGYVWKDQILKRDFKKMTADEWTKGVYYAFANNVSDNYEKDGKPNNPHRFSSFVTITGYALHKYFNTKLKMPIFMDARVGDEADGRSGKSVHCKAIREMLNADRENGKQCIILDGKNFDQENRFKYEDLHVSTRVLVLDDIKRGLPIELFFNSIVDGFMRERKGEKEKVRIWCKPIITLNYTMAIRGGSAKDRVVEFEFADFYSVTKTPEMVHGCWFFRDWNAEEWLRFDNFMLSCVSDYLRAGIIMPDTINLEARKLLDETDKEFINFMEDLEIEHEKDYDRRELFRKFGEVDDNNRVTRSGFHWLKAKTFTRWIQDYARYRAEIAGYRESRSGGKELTRFFFNQPVKPESLTTDAKNVKVVVFAEKATNLVAKEDLPF